MTTRGISKFKVAATYIGTVIGAGFASGQEILQFFGFFGYWGFAALFIATALFIYFGYIILKLGSELQADSHLPVIQYAGGKWVGKVVDIVITAFLFGAFTIMVAGSGAIFIEQLGLPKLLGAIIMVIATVATVFLGISGVITAISYVVPVLMVAVLGISIYAIVTMGVGPEVSQAAIAAGNPAIPFWPLSAVIYISYNLVMAVAVLAPLGKLTQNREVIRQGAIWGGVGLGIGAAAIFMAVLVHMPQSATFEIPMIFVANRIAPAISIGYAVILFIEVYTTAVGSLYGFSVRLAPPESRKMKYYAVGASVVGFFAAQLGFTNLVRILFPLVGYAGLLMLGGLLYRQFRPNPKQAAMFSPQPAFKKHFSYPEKPNDEEKRG